MDTPEEARDEIQILSHYRRELEAQCDALTWADGGELAEKLAAFVRASRTRDDALATLATIMGWLSGKESEVSEKWATRHLRPPEENSPHRPMTYLDAMHQLIGRVSYAGLHKRYLRQFPRT